MQLLSIYYTIIVYMGFPSGFCLPALVRTQDVTGEKE